MAEPPTTRPEPPTKLTPGEESEAIPVDAEMKGRQSPIDDRETSSKHSIEPAGETSSHERDEKAVEAGDDGPTVEPAERKTSTSTEPDVNGGEPMTLEKTGTNASKNKPLEERSKATIALIMFALGMATFLAALDTTIITTALPTIASELQLSEADYAWIGSSYMIASAASTPPWGKVSDIFGRKPILLTANAVFFVGSLICAVSINTGMLIAGRVIQGIGGGGLLSMVNICIADLVSPRNRGVYYGMIGGVWAIAGAMGPILGGVFTQYTTWRWCFYINLPCDGAAFLILVFYLQIETPKTPLLQGLKAIDWPGLLLIVGGVVMFLLGLEWGGVTFPWNSAIVICLIVFGIVALALFFVIEAKVAKYPIMPLRLFKKRNTLAAFGVCMAHGGSFISISYYLPLYFQAVLGASPLLSGAYQLPFMVGLSLTSIFVGVFIRKTGRYREATWGGMALLTIGTGLFMLLPSTVEWGRIAPFEIIAGLGAGPIFQSPLLALHANIHPKDIATGTATFAFVRQLFGGIGLVIGGVIFQNQMANTRAELLTFLNPKDGNIIASGAAGAGLQIVNHLPGPQRERVEVLYVHSLSTMWIFYTVLAGLGVGFGLLMTKKELSTQHQIRKQGLDQEEAGRQEELAKREKKGQEKETTSV